MDYDFSRLSTRSFEQLIQALAVCVIGPGVVVFGDGPDGGREATFEGRIPFPNESDPWHGYGVVQAKFRQRTSDKSKDGDWALSELEKDLKKFINPERGLRKPEYYLFATNAVLSPVAEKGGKDKATALMKKYRSLIGLKDFHIWDYDQICTLLDSQESVRIAYTAWITPGDVLAAVLENMKPSMANFRKVMLNFVQKELRSEQYVNLGQAGHNAQDRIPLAKVFVDLPVDNQADDSSSMLEGEIDIEPDSFVSGASGAINELLDLSSQRLDPSSNPTLLSTDRQPSTTISPGRVVYIGGPGQGKSTLTQFFCQMHRVALILDGEPGLLTPEVWEICELIKNQCTKESLNIPSLARFPIRVELNHFASELANSSATSLFDYILQRIRCRSEREIRPDDLRSWLEAYPWLIALDGLDEVPASSNRAQVLESINDFLIDAQESNADLLLISTSRPQGYNDDFSARHFLHRTLLPLDVPHALHYAGRLIDQRWGEDDEKVARLLERLRRAGTEEATVRLMRSPLQVTIMTLLVESLGEPPKERWRLFNEYYQVINRREKERDIPAAKLLNIYQADIDTIHQKVGLRLQVDSESSGGTEALLAKHQFAELVEQRLRDEGHSGKELSDLQRKIIDAALERLVFLVAPREEVIGFEIRSLQEFMAAQCLMNGSDEAVRRRLRAISHSAHWRNVFLFAAGRCFHDKQHLRDSLHTICCELNEGDGVPDGGELEKATLAGSLLALDILEDGSVANQPAQIKLYLRLALRLLELPPCPEQLRLAQQYKAEHSGIFKEKIERWIANYSVPQCLGGWQILIQLIGRDVGWALELADKYWPSDFRDAFNIIENIGHLHYSDWLSGRFYETILNTPVSSRHWDLISNLDGEDRLLSKSPCFLSVFIEKRQHYGAKGQIESSFNNLGDTIIFFQRSAFDFDESLLSEKAVDIHPTWEWIREAQRFAVEPSSMGLGQLLLELADLIDKGEFLLKDIAVAKLAWPIRACIVGARDECDLRYYADAALSGKLGGHVEWRLAEERWGEGKLKEEDLIYTPQKNLPFDIRITEIGYPLDGAGFSVAHSPEVENVVVALYSCWKQLSEGVVRSSLATCIGFLISVSGTFGQIISDDIVEGLPAILTERSKHLFRPGFIGALSDAFWEKDYAAKVLDDSFGSFDFESKVYWGVGYGHIRKLEDLFLKSLDKTNLMAALVCCCVNGYRPKNLDVFFDLEENLSVSHPALVDILRLVKLDDEEEASKLAKKQVVRYKAGSNRISDVLELIDSHEKEGRSIEAFLAVLHHELPPQAWETRRLVLQAMQKYQRKHLSNSSELQ